MPRRWDAATLKQDRMRDKTAIRSSRVRAVVLAPTYNNARMLYDVLTRIAAQGYPVMVVNDGSTDDTAGILERWKSEAGQGPEREVITHEVNRGKADALRTGFEAAAEAGYTHVLTIDTDGQLDPDQIQDLLAAAREHPRALIVGDRDMTAPDYPEKSRKGRRISNWCVWAESGLIISDSQCGFRVYPLEPMQFVHGHARRYGYETEILTRAAWAGIEVVSIPVRCAYDVPGGRISHLNPTIDTLRGIRMHLWLLFRTCLPFTKRVDTDRQPVMTGTAWYRLMRWFNPVRAWREVRHEPEGRQRFALGLSMGVFISNFPVYGIHTIMALWAAKKFKLHPVPLVVGSHLSTPPLTAPLIVLSIATGHLVLHGHWPGLHQYHQDSWTDYLWLMKSVLWEFVIGSLVFGFATAVLTYAITRACLVFAREDDGTGDDEPIEAPPANAHGSVVK
jgi:glycosyltransferase involved in cell wall biosynthesis